MKTCYIFCALPTAFRPAIEEGDFVVAADAGYRQLGGLRADLVVGDFDSLGYVPQGENVLVLPDHKDDTDTHYAVKLGLERGYRRFVLLGGVGGRLDHTLANIQTLACLTGSGARGCLVGDGLSLAMVQDGSLSFFGEPRGTISVFAQGGTAVGVTLEGLLYPLDQATVTTDFPIGVSNAFTGKSARVSVESGRLLVAWEGSHIDTDLFAG
jgi:thiamine pyrophosphokinase